MQKSAGVVFRKEVGLYRLAGLFAAIVLLLGLCAGQMAAQTINGQITGTVTDPTGAVVVGAKVTLTYPLTGQQREFTTDNSGNFIFPDIVPGTYDISVTQTGFQTYSQKDISVAATEKLDLHQMQLAVGSTATEITVQAAMTHVETDSSEHSSLVNSTQMTDVTVKGRNYMSYLSYLPGVTNTSPGGSDAPGWDATDGVTFNGGNNTVIVMLNGIASSDDGIGNSSASYLAPSPDAIQEMKVQTGNLNAEYGARNGGSINVVYKTGTRSFHGSLYDYQRNRFFNANQYFNKANNSPTSPTYLHPPAYNYANPGGTIGGPFYMPHVPFNKNRDKLFLFFSADLLRFRAGSTQQTTVPSQEERAGNFREIATNPATQTAVPVGAVRPGQPVVVGTPVYCPGTEPVSGASTGSPGPGNPYLTPAAAANLTTACAGTADAGITAAPWIGGSPLLSLFPLPTCNSDADLYNGGLGNGTEASTANPTLNIPACGAGLQGGYTNGYNYSLLVVQQNPRSDYVLTGQYNLSKSNIWTVDLTKDYQCQCGGTFLGANNGWDEVTTNYQIHSSAASSNLVSTIRPNLVNEFIAGTTRALQTVSPANTTNANTYGYLGRSERNLVGLGPTILPVIFPDPSNTKFGKNSQSLAANPFNYVPNFSFGNGYASTSGDNRYPFYGTDTHYNLQDDITWVKGAHSIKAGFYFEKVSRNGPAGGGNLGGWNGAVNFQGSSTNPNDINLGIANGYFGVFQSYNETSTHPNGYDRFHGEEWFVQDTWKAMRRLTLDYGIRFAHDVPTYDTVEVADFRPDEYNAAIGVSNGQPNLIYPCFNGAPTLADRAGCLGSGANVKFFTQSAIGDFAPAGVSGIFPFQGMQAYSPRQAVMNTPPLNILPRFGFAYDVFGNGKTAIRGGFGITNNVFGVVDTVGQLVLSPPSQSILSNPTTQQQLVPIPATNKQQLPISPTVFNSTLPTLLFNQSNPNAACSISSATSDCFVGPQNVIGLPRNFKDPQTYNFTFGVQHDLGHGLLLEASYVGLQNRHNSGSIAEDVQPYGINWLNIAGGYDAQTNCSDGTPVFQDPTAVGSGKSACTLLASSFFNYPSVTPGANGYTIQHANSLGIVNTNTPGYSGVSQTYDNLNSNYNSLQSQVSKRFGRTLTLNLAWTYQKTLGWSEPSLIAPKSVWRNLYYNRSGPTHNVVANWTYNLPQTHFQNAIVKQALGGWVYEGTFDHTSGSPAAVGISGNFNGGGGYGTRVNLVSGQSVYARGSAPPNSTTPLPYQYLNLAAFAAPTGGQGQCLGTAATCGFGNSGKVNYFGNDLTNFDMSIFKDFALSKVHESRKFEFRLETYNTFNHTEFTSVNATVTGVQQTAGGAGTGFTTPAANNSTFGRFTNTQPQRIISLAAKIIF